MSLDCVKYCAFYSILFSGGGGFPDTVYVGVLTQYWSVHWTLNWTLQYCVKTPKSMEEEELMKQYRALHDFACGRAMKIKLHDQ